MLGVTFLQNDKSFMSSIVNQRKYRILSKYFDLIADLHQTVI